MIARLAPFALLLTTACGFRTALVVDQDVLCVELPQDAPPAIVDVTFEARIQAAELAFLVDQTGSMGDEGAAIRNGLLDTILPAVEDAIPSVRISVAGVGDFPIPPYGDATDRPFALYTASTADLDVVSGAVARLAETRFYGSDVPEAQLPALHALVSGSGYLDYIDEARCPPGGVGHACFGPTGARIVLLFTDAPFHGGPSGALRYTDLSLWPAPASYDETVAAVRAAGARVIGLYSGDPGGDSADLETLVADTGALDASGRPLFFDIGRRGEHLDDGVVAGITALASETSLDVDLAVADVPGDAVDATEFLLETVALSADPPTGADPMGARFANVRPGTRLTFRLVLANDRIPSADEPIILPMRLLFRDLDSAILGEETLYAVIPSLTGVGCEAVRP